MLLKLHQGSAQEFVREALAKLIEYARECVASAAQYVVFPSCSGMTY